MKKLIVFLIKTVVTLILAFVGVVGLVIAAAFIMEKFEDDEDFDFDEENFEEDNNTSN